MGSFIWQCAREVSRPRSANCFAAVFDTRARVAISTHALGLSLAPVPPPSLMLTPILSPTLTLTLSLVLTPVPDAGPDAVSNPDSGPLFSPEPHLKRTHLVH